jgi:hypothetical protein|tara:strand:+ start:1321 stop:1767 length:447 start_codon:yes stop_codon:yes gene_type:complete
MQNRVLCVAFRIEFRKLSVKHIKIMKKYFVGTLILLIAISFPVLYDIAKIKWYMASPVSFDRDKWNEAFRSEKLEDRYLRLQMASYIIETDQLSGLDAEGVIGILGSPQSHEAIPGFAYWLSPFGLDSAWLQVEYTDNRVSKYSVVTD